MEIGFIGLGKMGSRMAGKLLRENHDLVVWNRSQEAIDVFLSEVSRQRRASPKVGREKLAARGEPRQRWEAGNLKIAKTIEELVNDLKKPRVVWLMLPAGEATENILDEVRKFVERRDVVIDGGNAYYKDTQRRYEEFKKRGVRFLGIGVSGGIIAAKTGYPMMVGGDKNAYCYIVPLLDSLAKPNGGHEYFGEGGAGHFVKMIHNGIEYGIMQSLAEGFDVLEHSPYKLDLLKIAKLYQKGTLVSGFMLDRAVDVLKDDPHLSKIEGVIAESGEARWTIEQAKKEKVPVEIIEHSLDYRRRSQKDLKIQKSFTAKMVASLRSAFGGHPIRQAQGKKGKKK